MSLIEDLKKIPKIDTHINFLSSISPDLIIDVDDSNDLSVDILDMTTFKRYSEYDNCLMLPIKLLNSKKNIKLAIINLIDSLIEKNIIYSELFIDIHLYNKNIKLEEVIKVIINTIKEKNYDLKLILVTNNEESKENNIELINLIEKYKLNGLYFKKNKTDNLADYIYLFDRLIKLNIPYIIPYDNKINNQIWDIYEKSYRIEYLVDYYDEELLDIVKNNNILLEISITKLQELNYSNDYYKLIKDLIENGYNILIYSGDMTILNTDIINELCLLFTNCNISLRDLIRLLINNINNLKIDNILKEKLILILKEEGNKIL